MKRVDRIDSVPGQRQIMAWVELSLERLNAYETKDQKNQALHNILQYGVLAIRFRNHLILALGCRLKVWIQTSQGAKKGRISF
jgi:hypothetical protein